MRIHKICHTPPPQGVGAPPRRPAPSRSLTQIAVRERVDNIRITPLGPPGRQVASAAVEVAKLWTPGKRLRIAFLDGIPEVQAKVAAIAKEWEEVANLRLDFVTGGASDIRISFAEKGFSWSYVGTDAAGVPRRNPTMNYGWLEPSTAMREYQRVVRHEFGHALGMIHEHQNPAALGKIPWDRPKVYAHYAAMGWTKEDVDFNVFQTYDEDATNFSAYDPTSIMQYAVPDSLTLGSFAISWNTALSATDKEFMARQYPADASPMVELEVDGARVAADLASAGETDTFHLQVTEEATYIMTTTGATDTVLTLQGPNDPGAVLAWDDDLGAGTNARLVRKLGVGEYWLTVRHKTPGGVGTYDIGVKRRKG